MQKLRHLLLTFSGLLVFHLPGQAPLPPVHYTDPAEQHWIDSVYQAMTEDERLGQLFMLRAHTDKGATYERQVGELIAAYQVGGVCFFQGSPERQVEVLNAYQQSMRHVPLLVATDAEWGLGMRLKSQAVSFPYQLTLGAIRDNRLLYRMGAEIAGQLRRMGVHVNFAPVADVNNNPNNPVINYRSFGEDRYNVAVKSYMYGRGMQDHGVLACAKHFPGHGDTDVDSHLDLPVITHSRRRLDSIELFPFRVLAQHGIGSMMVAHLDVPAIDERENRPTTLSRPAVSELLRRDLGFRGLIFTDALDMKGVTKYYDSGEVEAEALLAGNDMLLLPEDLRAAVAAIKRYIAEGKLSRQQVDASVKRILRAKYRLGLQDHEPVVADSVAADITPPRAMALKQELYENALTLVRNPENFLPFGKTDSMQLAAVSIGARQRPLFQERLADYASMKQWQLGKYISDEQRRDLVRELNPYDAVIVSLHGMSHAADRDFGISAASRRFIEDLSEFTKVILVVFGNPYSLGYFDEVDWLVAAYEEDELMQDVAAQGLFGALPIDGRLPVTASPRARFNQGVRTASNFRLGYALPERMGMKTERLDEIERLARHAIDTGATPGCVVLVAKDGRIVYEKAFGYHTYRKKRPVKTDDLYDIASVTKIAATTLAVMHLEEAGKIDIEQPLSRYLPELAGTNKSGLIIRDVMAHHAGLRDWIPFYEQTLTGSRRRPRPSPRFYREAAGGDFNVPVTGKLFLRQDFIDTIWQQIFFSELRPERNYRYSDLGFYLLARQIRQQTGLSLDAYVDRHFYRPMGLQRITYNPHRNYSSDLIPPTEDDRYWRGQRVQGYVHDMGAAMLGGVSGHAGLFSTARDLAALLQMLLWDGRYAGQQLLQPATIRKFTTRHPRSTRRAIGFDMPELSPDRPPNLSTQASPDAFGHLGFTGTAAWADPEHNLVYVFLSNRTFPSMDNYKLNRLDFRPRLQDAAYDAIQDHGP